MSYEKINRFFLFFAHNLCDLGKNCFLEMLSLFLDQVSLEGDLFYFSEIKKEIEIEAALTNLQDRKNLTLKSNFSR